MLAALAELRQIRIRTSGAGTLESDFLIGPAHFRNPSILQIRGVAEQASGEVVLRFEISADIRA